MIKFTILSAALALATGTVAAAVPHYAVAGRIAGPDGGWDYASIDPQAGRLYVARSANITVIDLTRPDSIGQIGVIERGHAVVPIAGSNILLVTSGHDDSVRIFDLSSGRETARIAVGADPDAAFYDPADGVAAVMNAKAGTVSLIDPKAARVTATIALKPGLEFAVIGTGRIVYVNNEDRNEIETIDLRSGKAGGTIALPGCESPSGLGFDKASNRLISACANGKAAIVDPAAGREIGLLDIGRGPDAVIIDAKRRLAFVPCGRDGTLTLIALDSPGGAKVIGTVITEKGARTGSIDPRDGTLYLPTAAFNPPAAPGGRPTAIPGTFHILVVKPR
jgi:DNA-binding beta-propeller fold protein YncE